MDGGLGHCTGGSDQDHPQEKEEQKSKMNECLVNTDLMSAFLVIFMKAEDKDSHPLHYNDIK